MIRRLLFAAAAVASFPLILGPSPAAIAAPASDLIQMGHISIKAVGKGDPVILIPGLASPRAVWDGVLPELAKHHRVYLVQVNGFAGDEPRDNLTPGVIDGLVAELHAYIVEHKLQGAAVVGHSLGGLAGLMLAKAHPGDVGRLMVVDALPFIGEIFVPGATVAMVEPRAAAMRDQLIAGYGKPADKPALDATAAALALKPASRAQVSAWSAAADPRVVGQAMYEDLTTDLRPGMAAIATPITLVYPWSAGMPKARAEPFYRTAYAGAPNMTFIDVGDAAHFVMLDQPEAFRAALAAFLAT
ncbi:MAG: alpha/beta hydrolase [Pseudomonadota bacterium]